MSKLEICNTKYKHVVEEVCANLASRGFRRRGAFVWVPLKIAEATGFVGFNVLRDRPHIARVKFTVNMLGGWSFLGEMFYADFLGGFKPSVRNKQFYARPRNEKVEIWWTIFAGTDVSSVISDVISSIDVMIESRINMLANPFDILGSLGLKTGIFASAPISAQEFAKMAAREGVFQGQFEPIDVRRLLKCKRPARTPPPPDSLPPQRQ